ncbi:MAG: hypothetical protein AAF393_15745 [Pseudomonadota bacterium]
MASFSLISAVTDNASRYLLGASDVDLVLIEGSWRLVVSAEADNALTVFEFSGGTIGSKLDEQTYSSGSGTRTTWALHSFFAHGQTVFAPATRYEDDPRLYTIGFNGAFQAQDPNLSGDLGVAETITVGSSTYFYSQAINSSVLHVYRVEVNFSFSQVQTIADTSSTYLGDVSALATTEAFGNDYLFVASAFDGGLSSYEVGSNGTLSLRDTVTPGDGQGFYLPSSLLAVDVGSTDFVIMGSSGTSSLTVYRVESNGDLTEVDHLLDTLETRFQGVTQLATFSFDGKNYVLAAGNDDGISALEIGNDGQLTHRGSVADTYDSTLDNISGLDVEIVDDQVFVIVSSPTDHGITVLELTFDEPPDPDPDPDPDTNSSGIIGTKGDDYLRGTSGADMIYGLDGNDFIQARGGSDTIYDGAGRDVIESGGGQDEFIFHNDDALDCILDFRPDADIINLSAYTGVNSLQDLVFTDFCVGVLIEANNDRLILMDHGNYIFDLNTLSHDNFIF